MTTRGFKVNDAVLTAYLVADALVRPRDEVTFFRVRDEVSKLVRRYRVYGTNACA
jgi:glycine/serine hydroxymethyltransferase